MSADAVTGWVLTVAAQLRLSQAETPSDLVEVAGRTTPSAIGRCPAGNATAKSRIRRARRFCDNDHVHAAGAMPRAVRRLTGKRQKPPLVAPGWTDIGAFNTLMAAAG